MMLLRRLVILIALALAPLVAPGGASAHQQKIAISTVSQNPRSGGIEIAHQVPVHDAEHVLRIQGSKNPDIVGSADSREAFAAYVTTRFMLEVDGTVVQPTYVGSEIIGGSLWVYQEAPALVAGAPGRLRINSQILTNVWARQENRVNIGSGTNVATLIFHQGDAAKEGVLTR